MRRELLRQYSIDARRTSHGDLVYLPIASDVFFLDKQSLLYILVLESMPTQGQGGKRKVNDKVEIGYLGDSNQVGSLNKFAEAVTEFFSANNQSLQW
ncbi:MAG TPA: hypothetical protein VEP90_15005 [Methylomirabilota bacterium]|nr:hypothetical protein [Methylomirabilota bacterium]